MGLSLKSVILRQPQDTNSISLWKLAHLDDWWICSVCEEDVVGVEGRVQKGGKECVKLDSSVFFYCWPCDPLNL